MEYNTGDITDDGSIYIDREHYRTFKDGIIGTLIDDTDRDSILIPTDQLDDSEAEALSTAVRIISGTMDVTEDMMKDLDFLLSMIYISRYMDSRKLLQIISSSLIWNKCMELLFWFTISKLDDNIWDDLTGKSISLDYVDNSGEYRTVSYGYHYNIPSDNDSFFALFGMNVYNMGGYIYDKYLSDTDDDGGHEYEYKYKYDEFYWSGGWDTIENIEESWESYSGLPLKGVTPSSSSIVKFIANKNKDLRIDYIILDGADGDPGDDEDLKRMGAIAWCNNDGVNVLNEGKYFDFKRKHLDHPYMYSLILDVDSMDIVSEVLDTIPKRSIGFINSVKYNERMKIVYMLFTD